MYISMFLRHLHRREHALHRSGLLDRANRRCSAAESGFRTQLVYRASEHQQQHLDEDEDLHERLYGKACARAAVRCSGRVPRMRLGSQSGAGHVPTCVCQCARGRSCAWNVIEITPGCTGGSSLQR